MCYWYSLKRTQATHVSPGTAKSYVRVVRVVHFEVRATAFFQMTCPWTTDFFLKLNVVAKNISQGSHPRSPFEPLAKDLLDWLKKIVNGSNAQKPRLSDFRKSHILQTKKTNVHK